MSEEQKKPTFMQKVKKIWDYTVGATVILIICIILLAIALWPLSCHHRKKVIDDISKDKELAWKIYQTD